jgi:hypothetical protein
LADDPKRQQCLNNTKTTNQIEGVIMTLVQDKPKKALSLKQERIAQRNTDLDKYRLGEHIRYHMYKHRVGLLATAAVAQPVLAFAVFVFRANI